jgi:hypothetical protein
VAEEWQQQSKEYQDLYEQGLRWQDWASKILAERMYLTVTSLVSYEGQTETGETLQGIEFKLDLKYQKTGNLYIETHEKRAAGNGEYVPSGLLRQDNTWLWIQGDYHNLFGFAKRWLMRVHQAETCKVVETPTSRGFLLKPSLIERAAFHLEVA